MSAFFDARRVHSISTAATDSRPRAELSEIRAADSRRKPRVFRNYRRVRAERARVVEEYEKPCAFGVDEAERAAHAHNVARQGEVARCVGNPRRRPCARFQAFGVVFEFRRRRQRARFRSSATVCRRLWTLSPKCKSARGSARKFPLRTKVCGLSPIGGGCPKLRSRWEFVARNFGADVAFFQQIGGFALRFCAFSDLKNTSCPPAAP